MLIAPRHLDDLVVLDHEPCHRFSIELARDIRALRLF
jgi:hypothetical protein